MATITADLKMSSNKASSPPTPSSSASRYPSIDVICEEEEEKLLLEKLPAAATVVAGSKNTESMRLTSPSLRAATPLQYAFPGAPAIRIAPHLASDTLPPPPHPRPRSVTEPSSNAARAAALTSVLQSQLSISPSPSSSASTMSKPASSNAPNNALSTVITPTTSSISSTINSSKQLNPSTFLMSSSSSPCSPTVSNNKNSSASFIPHDSLSVTPSLSGMSSPSTSAALSVASSPTTINHAVRPPSSAEIAAMVIPRYVPPAIRRRANSFMSSRFGKRIEDYELLDTIGTGTFGRVYLCRSRSGNSNEYFAMKVLKKADVVRLKQVEHINSEKNILAAIRHPFVVTLHTTFQDETNLYMLLEYVVGGELFSHLRRAGRFSNEVTRFFAAEIVLAVDYMHSRDIIYRDLKPENLLLDKSGHIKITDFGFAKRVEERTWTLCGTPEYLAPEIIQSKGHGKAVDWWALGILIFEMLAGYPPFFDDNPFGIYEKILAGRIQFPAHFHPNAKDIIRRLLTADRAQRLGNLRGGSADVKRHRWFRGIDWDALYNRAVPAPIQPRYRGPGDTGNFEKYPEGPQRDRPTPGAPDPYRHLFMDF